MNDIDIESLSRDELIALNHRIVDRLKFLNHAAAHEAMVDLNLGERVSFTPRGQRPKTGVVAKYNKQTVTVITEDGEHWNVAPTLLTKADLRELEVGNNPKVIDISVGKIAEQ